MSATRSVDVECVTCGSLFKLLQREGLGSWWPTAGECDDCERKRMESVRAEQAQRETPFWHRRFIDLCPSEFLSTVDRRRLPDLDAYDRVQEWRPKAERSSLLLVGPTGLGKTRAAYSLLRELLREQPNAGLEHFNCVTFGETARARTYAGKGSEWFDRLGRIDLVFFDDMFRGVLTEQIQEELFGLISIRTERHLPIIATTQFTRHTLKDVMAGHHAGAISRRISDFFQVVVFRHKT